MRRHCPATLGNLDVPARGIDVVALFRLADTLHGLLAMLPGRGKPGARSFHGRSALAVDTISLMDALGIEKAILGGFDWGARTANIVAAVWPERTKALVSVSGYLIGSQAANRAPLPPQAELAWWYQFYFATERGQAGYESSSTR